MRALPCIVAATLTLALVAGTARADDDAAMKALRIQWAAKQAEIKDLTIEQEARLTTAQGAMSYDMVVKSKGDKVRTEVNLRGLKAVTIFDGADFWSIGPLGTHKVPRPGNVPNPSELRTLPEDARILRTERVSDRDCSMVEVKHPGTGQVTLMWVDAKDIVLVKSEAREGQDTTAMVFSDFRKVDGAYTIPFKAEMSRNGAPTGDTTIKSVKVNSGLPDDLFIVKATQASASPLGLPTPKGVRK